MMEILYRGPTGLVFTLVGLLLSWCCPRVFPGGEFREKMTTHHSSDISVESEKASTNSMVF